MTIRRLLLAAALLTVAPSILAQQDPVRDARLRDALRRSQAALRAAEDKSAALAKENTSLASDRQRDDETLKRSGTQLSNTRGELAALRSKLDAVNAELAAARAVSQAERNAATLKLDDSARRLAASDAALRERTQTVTALSELLERATRSLADAQAANRKMYAFGRELIEQYRTGTPAAQVLAGEPVLGFGAIRLENNAEDLRGRLESARLPGR